MRQRHSGFTLVEILIVVMILGIIAAIVVPQFATASGDSREKSVQSSLRMVRSQIELFKLEHDGIPPQPSGMWSLLTHRSNSSETATSTPTGTAHGPYILMPPRNPLNSQSAVSTATTDTTAGWFYTADTSTFEFRARNADGTVNLVY